MFLLPLDGVTISKSFGDGSSVFLRQSPAELDLSRIVGSILHVSSQLESISLSRPLLL